MREILLSTETGSDVPPDMAEKYRIRIVPMHVIMDGIDYPDGSDFPVEKIYDYYERTKRVPSTSCVNVHEYGEFFRKIREEYPDCVIFHFAYSSNASATYQSALAALEEFEDIHLIDTATATAGCLVHILAGYEHIQKNHGPDTDYAVLADEIRAIAPRIACSFIPGNLEFLRAGGRVSNAAYLGGTLLQLKPLIDVNREGRLVVTKKHRGSMEKIAGRFVNEFVTEHGLNRDTLYLIHTPGTAKKVLELMEEAARGLGFKDCVTIRTGGVISCHSGPGSIGLAGLAD